MHKYWNRFIFCSTVFRMNTPHIPICLLKEDQIKAQHKRIHLMPL